MTLPLNSLPYSPAALLTEKKNTMVFHILRVVKILARDSVSDVVLALKEKQEQSYIHTSILMLAELKLSVQFINKIIKKPQKLA